MSKIQAEIRAVISGFIENPFLPSQYAVYRIGKRTASEIINEHKIAQHYDYLIKENKDRLLEQFLLAIALYQILEGHQKRAILSAKYLPTRYINSIPKPHSIDQFKNLAASAGMVHRALKRIIGDGVRNSKQDAWSACYGKTLDIALYRQKMIREHNILILGETGTGKELFASALLKSDFGENNFSSGETRSINLASIPKELIPSSLFGSMKGAFTGATADRAGILKITHNGSVFLDEIGDIPIETQVALLRVIETKKVLPIGSTSEEDVVVRYISATNADLSNSEKFRQDLLQRLSGLTIHIPPLRNNKNDIINIGKNYLDLLKKGQNLEKVMDRQKDYQIFLEKLAMLNYEWPGNVRELRNQIRNYLMGLPTILNRTQVERISKKQVQYIIPDEIAEVISHNCSVKELTDQYISHICEKYGMNYSQAAKVLNVDRTTVMRRVKSLHE